MTFLLGVLLILVPLCIGNGIKILYDKGQRTLCLVYVSGSMAVFLWSGLCQFVTLMGKFSFSWYQNVFMAGVLVLTIMGILIGTFAGKGEPVRNESIREKLVPMVAFFGLGVFLIIFSATDRTGDFTLETVQTTLETDGIYEFNSFTGLQIEAGMPVRQKILTPAILYAAFSDFFRVPAQRVVHIYIPVWLLLNGICVAVMWAEAIYKEVRCQKLFLWFFMALMVCGGYGYSGAGYQLWSRGYTGNAFVTIVIVPVVVYACYKRNWMILLLACATEVFVAWTTYGVGFGVIAALLCLGVIWIQRFIKRSGKDEKCI